MSNRSQQPDDSLSHVSPAADLRHATLFVAWSMSEQDASVHAALASVRELA